jgi:hypothetical protein
MPDSILLCIVVSIRDKYGYVTDISVVKKGIKNSGSNDNKIFFSNIEFDLFISLEIK